MAKVQLKLPTEYIAKLDSLGANMTEVCKRAVYVGAGIVADAVKAGLLSVHTPRTGDLERSLGIAPIKPDGDGANTKIGFDGTSTKRLKNGEEYEVANALKARVLESGKSGQPARPFMRKALNSSRSAAQAAMRAEFEKEIEKYMN